MLICFTLCVNKKFQQQNRKSFAEKDSRKNQNRKREESVGKLIAVEKLKRNIREQVQL